MSHCFEESPVSDLKMDISDTPTSLSSPELLGKGGPCPSLSFSGATHYSESDPDDGLRILHSSLDVENSNRNDEDDGGSESTTTSFTNSLDNRRLPFQLISVHNHPLMSPQAVNNVNNASSTNEFFGDDDFKDTPTTNPPSNQQQSPLRLANPLIGSNKSSPKRHARLDVLEKDPCNVSSDSEADLSQYQANVEPSYQSVSLVSRPNAVSSPKKRSMKSNSCSNIDTEEDHLPPRPSSIESLSVRSFDELDGMSRSSSTSLFVVDVDGQQPSSAIVDDNDEQPRSSRNKQKVVLPDGTTREIDMKVIEPYKRVLSHGGYLREDCQNAIVIFSSCFLPDRSRADYHYVMDSLFLYVLKTLEQLVTEDYVLLYLHGGSCKSNVPSFPWLKRCYQLLDRRLRKSLKNVYMVHPTFWLKSLVWMSRPFISSKFWKKLVYVKSLEELYALVPSVERQAVPEKVKNYDLAHFKKD